MRAGLEVHQQLATGKLFCNCPSELSEEASGQFLRRLRPTGGENHAVDPAVAFEASRGLSFRYETTRCDCLVEADEEPPHALNPEALEAALTVSLLLHARPLDEITVMRKIVIDGSNTAGFQRTALIAVDGHLEVGQKRYSIPTVCLEEDAARRMGDEDGSPRFRLDRLGIPLIEVATGPEITSGAEAREVAEEIGALLRATKRVRRGIGTIREDLNVSIPDGTRVELKGVQELRLIQRYVESEEERQRVLLSVRDSLRAAGAPPPADRGTDVTELFSAVETGPLRSGGGSRAVILALRLPGFGGQLGSPTPGGERLGRELADHARTAGLGGLLHSDELPGYGIDAALVGRLRGVLGCGEGDGFLVLSAPTREKAERALERVRARVLAAFDGVPPETRDPLPDGRTRYSRPLPGSDRMYPETDIPPIPVGAETLARLRDALPEMPGATRARVGREFALHAEVVRRLQREGSLEMFESLVGRGHPAATVARLLTQDIDEARADLPEGTRAPTEEEYESVLAALAEGRFAKEGAGRVLRRLLEEGGGVEAALRATGLEPLSREELERLANELVSKNAALLAEKEERALSALMGDLMRRVRGRRDGREVAEVLRAAVAAARPRPRP